MIRWLQPSSTISLLAIVLLFLPTRAPAQLFRIDTLARAPYAQYPVGVAFIPGEQGSFFFTEKSSGRIRLFRETLQPEPFATVPVEDEGEQGLLGIAVHPNYPAEPYVYVFHTRRLDRSNLVVRFRDSSGVGIDPRLIQIFPRTDDGTSNNGGSIHFGPDGMLYVGVGDFGTGGALAQDTATRRNYLGKLLRFNPDGTIPADGPMPGKAFWSFGHRNLAGFSFDEETGTLYCVEGGTRIRNQVFAVPPGGNLGWPVIRPGGSTPPGMVRPLFTFPPGPQPALTAVVAYRGKGFPRLVGKILFAGHANPTIWVGSLNAGRDSLSVEPLFRSNAGYADVEVAPDGGIVFTNGPYVSSRILKIAPVAPAFLSTPPVLAVEREEFFYMPLFSGTPPSLTLLEGPPGMVVDSSTWTVRWTPIWRREYGGLNRVRLRADNGAGSDEQRFTIQVVNVNDPPSPFVLREPEPDHVRSFLGVDPEVTLQWQHASDADGDSIRYVVEMDTTEAFAGGLIRDTVVTVDSLRLTLPRRSGTYYWRVTATDGFNATRASGGTSRFGVTYLPPALARADRVREEQPLLQQNFPNPFNPATSISFTLQRAGHVRLAVFNLLGQEVAVLLDDVRPEGRHSFEFVNVDLPSGIYFYRLQAPGLFETKKMVIAK